jgi:pimeloyl-ACP methyl ester carboxylesterase
LAFRAGLSGSQLAIVPGTGHGLLMEKPDLCNRIIIGFLAEPADEAAGGR